MRAYYGARAVHDDVRLDDFERYLLTAPILHASTNAAGGAHPSYLVILEGGTGVLVKPEDVVAGGDVMTARETAAWVVARELGWPDLVSTTVRREIDSYVSGDRVMASVQVLWPSNQPGTPLDELPDDDLSRAALFDALVFQSDRNSGNWLGVPNDGGRPRLKLIDHGYAFDLTRGFQSPFFDRFREQPLTDDARDALRRIRAPRHTRALEELLPPDELRAFHARAEALESVGTFRTS
jgi:hypothetical protein